MSTYEDNYSEIIGTEQDLDALEKLLEDQWEIYENNYNGGRGKTRTIFDSVEWGECEWGYWAGRISPTRMNFSLEDGAIGAEDVLSDATANLSSVEIISYIGNQELDTCWITPPGIDLGFWSYPNDLIGSNHNAYFLTYLDRKYGFSEEWAEPILDALGLDGETDKNEMEDLFNHTAILIHAGIIDEPADDPLGWGRNTLIFTGTKLELSEVEKRLREVAPKVKDLFLYEDISLLKLENSQASMQALSHQGELEVLVNQLIAEFSEGTVKHTFDLIHL